MILWGGGVSPGDLGGPKVGVRAWGWDWRCPEEDLGVPEGGFRVHEGNGEP